MPKKAVGYDQLANEVRRVAVMQEAMQGDVKRIAEGHSDVVRRFDAVDRRFDGVDRRIDDTQRALTEAVKALTTEIKGLKEQIGALQQAVLELRTEVRTIGERLEVHLQQAHAT